MYSNDYMYAIERNDEYLAHYGIRGMKWGVRKAIARGNSRALRRQYQKAAKKLAKLDKQAANSKKYWRRAGIMGAGAAVAGGAAALGTQGVGRLVARGGDVAATASHKVGKLLTRIPGTSGAAQAIHRTGSAMMTAGGVGKGRGAIRSAGGSARRAIEQWGKSDSLSRAIRTPMINGAVSNAGNVAGKGLNKAQGALRGVSNNTIARIGAGAIGAGLAVGAARNAYKAKTAQKRAAQFRSEMNKAFAGTQYGKNGNRQGGKKRRRR